jgi:ABC-2 type transport system permease protein
MYKLFAAVKKELLLLRRDVAGLLVLFVMPAILVVVVTLVQENVSKTIGDSALNVLLIDQDKKLVGLTIEKELFASRSINVNKIDILVKSDIGQARDAVAGGKYQFCIVIPEGMTDSLNNRVLYTVKQSFSNKNQGKHKEDNTKNEAKKLIVYADPALREGIRRSIVNFLEKLLLSIELEEKMGTLTRIFPEEIQKKYKEKAGPYWPMDLEKIDIPTSLQWSRQSFLGVEEIIATGEETLKTFPSTMQQNIPAWTIFGMFFIVVPLGGSLIRERQNGTLARLLAMPVSPFTILSGKIIAYVIICLIQFFLILVVGKTLLPLLGTPVLYMGQSIFGIILITLCSALAACGYGILIGTLARTYEQASMFGAVSVVIAAALGGIMVPIYVMPKLMQNISLFSPLSWGLTGYITLFVRGGGLLSVIREISLLLGFFIATTFCAWFTLFYREKIST